MFLKFEFQIGLCSNFGAVGVKTRPFPFTRHVAYITACNLLYRTSCDADKL